MITCLYIGFALHVALHVFEVVNELCHNHIGMYICIYIHASIRICIHSFYIHMYKHTCILMCMHTYIHVSASVKLVCVDNNFE